MGFFEENEIHLFFALCYFCDGLIMAVMVPHTMVWLRKMSRGQFVQSSPPEGREGVIVVLLDNDWHLGRTQSNFSIP